MAERPPQIIMTEANYYDRLFENITNRIDDQFYVRVRMEMYVWLSEDPLLNTEVCTRFPVWEGVYRNTYPQYQETIT